MGSANSSNSNRLREVAIRQGAAAYLIDDASDIRPEWLSGCRRVGVTAGASAPEILVEEVIETLKKRGGRVINQNMAEPETVTFSLPKALR